MLATTPGAVRASEPVSTSTALWAATLALLRLNLRRDRARMIIWPVVIALVAVGIARAWDALYPTAEGRQELAATVAATPSLTALLGPLWDPISTGGLTAWRSLAAVVFVIGLVNVFTVVRHTRAEEALGRAELLRSARTGRLAIPSSGVLVTLLLDLAVGAVTALALVSRGLPAAGSAMYGATVALCSAVFAGVALVTAQLTATSRTASGVGATVLAATLVLAATGNVQDPEGGTWVWLSPIGWAQQARVFADARVEVLLLPVAVLVVLMLIGFVMASRRDLGASQWPSRPGSPTARAWIAGPVRFAWRLDRTWVLSWLVGVAVMGAFIGSILTSAVDLVEGNPALSDFIAALGGTSNISDAFGVAMLGIIALGVAGFGISTVLRLRTDETEGRAEALLTRAVPRVAWAAGHTSSAFIGTAAIMVVAGAAIGASYGARIDDLFGQSARWAAAGLVPLVAPFVVIAFTLLLIGIAPRLATPVAWTVLGLCVLLATLGEVLNLPQWVMDASPFTHVPLWPSVPMDWVPIAAMGVIVIAFSMVGLTALRRRDLPR